MTTLRNFEVMFDKYNLGYKEPLIT